MRINRRVGGSTRNDLREKRKIKEKKEEEEKVEEDEKSEVQVHYRSNSYRKLASKSLRSSRLDNNAFRFLSTFLLGYRRNDFTSRILVIFEIDDLFG